MTQFVMDPNSNLSSDTYQKMLKNVKGLMLCRIIILTLLLTITFLFQISEKKYFFIPMTNQFYYFISLFYLDVFSEVYNFREKNSPTRAGSENTSLNFENNDPYENPSTIGLGGTGPSGLPSQGLVITTTPLGEVSR